MTKEEYRQSRYNRDLTLANLATDYGVPGTVQAYGRSLDKEELRWRASAWPVTISDYDAFYEGVACDFELWCLLG